MSRIGLFSLGILAVGTSAVTAYIARPRPDYGLTAERRVIDVGMHGQGETAAASFKLVNRSSATIRVLDVLHNCDCVETKLAKQSLESGEATSLDIPWETRTRRGDTGAELTVVWVKPDGRTHFTPLALQAHVEPDFDVTPITLEFSRGGAQRVRLSFTPRRVAELTLYRAYVTHRAFTVKLAPDECHVEIEFDPSRWPEEGADAELVVENNSPHEARYRAALNVRR